ncbi:hypothetical protein [Arcanobacterium canis]
MAVFALENGRLVAAPSHPQLSAEQTAQLLAAVSTEAVALLDHPLFEVGWVSSDVRGGSQESLIALDPSGQVVTIEVHKFLDAAGLLSSLARAGRHADLSRARLAALFGGEHNFTSEFQNFIDTTTPVTRGGPRLFLFASEIAQDVLAPLVALGGQGIEANRIVLHDGANGVLVELAKIVREIPGILTPARTVVEVEAAAPQESEENPWHITGWNSADVPRPPRYTPPVKEKPVSEEENPVLVAMEKETTKSVPHMDPQEMAEYTSDDASSVRTDTAIMLAELSEGGFEALQPLEVNKPDADTILSAHAGKGNTDSVMGDDHLGHIEETPAGPQLEALMYEEARRAARRPEQRLWDDAAPEANEHQIFDEGASAREAEAAVARAAYEHPHGWSHPHRSQEKASVPSEQNGHETLIRIAAQVNAPTTVRWYSRRRGIDVQMTLTESGFLRGEDGTEYATAQEAADAVGAGKYRNAWLVWQLDSGQRLADFL